VRIRDIPDFRPTSDLIVEGAYEGVRRTLIVEPNPDGHRLWYVRLLIDHIKQRTLPPPCVVTTETAPRSIEWAVHLGNPPHMVSPIDRKGNWTAATARLLASSSSPFIVPDGDSIIQHLLKYAIYKAFSSRRPRGVILLMRMHPHPTLVGLVRFLAKVIVVLLMRAWAPDIKVATLESRLSQQHRLVKALGIPAVPDPVYYMPSSSMGPSWLAQHGLDRGLPTFLIIGELSERKSVPEILQAWTNCQPAAAQLVLVGRPTDAIRTYLQGMDSAQSSSVKLFDEYLPDSAFDTWIGSAQYVFVLHKNEGSSGVLLKCAAAGTAVIAGGSRSVVETFLELGMSGHLSSCSPEQLGEVITRSLLHPVLARPLNHLPTVSDFAHALLSCLPPVVKADESQYLWPPQ
jgi:hypothetical protein